MKTVEEIALETANTITAPYITDESLTRFATKFLEAYIAQQEPVAHVYLHDIQQSRELGTYAPAYPVPVGTAFNKSVPVFLAPPTAKQEPTSYQFQDRNGQWKDFLDQRHYENTVEDGSWPIRALYTAPPTAMEGWQSIETAPKDGTIVIFAGELDHSGDWRMKMGYWSIPECRWYLFGGSWRPTHWQPLPPPPGEKK